MELFTLDIPRPPSVNRFKHRLGNSSPNVVNWVSRADSYLRAAGRYPRIRGPYELFVVFAESDFGRWDPDNRLKCLCDWLQRVELIENDKLARLIMVEWGVAPLGCRVQLRKWSNGNGNV